MTKSQKLQRTFQGDTTLLQGQKSKHRVGVSKCTFLLSKLFTLCFIIETTYTLKRLDIVALHSGLVAFCLLTVEGSQTAARILKNL